MGQNIRLNPGELRTFAGQYKSEASNVGDQINRLNGLINNLQDAWAGEASNAFAERYEEHRVSFQKMQQLLEEIGQQLDSTATALESADQDVAGQIRG